MRLERVTDSEHGEYQRAMALYRLSFPCHEQREAHSQRDILSDSDYHFTLAYDGQTLVGIALYWETDGFIYVEHFCILPEMRNMRYGQQVLALLKTVGKTVILEIDPPVDEVAIRRKGFYERNGFTDNPYPHIHPPYHKGNPGHELVIMSCPGPIAQATYNDFNRYLRQHVMDGAFR